VNKNTDEQDWTDYLIANPFNPANPLFFTSSVNTIFPEELEKQAPATSSRRGGFIRQDADVQGDSL
jgi:hypothetical protein